MLDMSSSPPAAILVSDSQVSMSHGLTSSVYHITVYYIVIISCDTVYYIVILS